MARKPSLSSLRLFMQVAYNRSFSETGRLANVSQPALSRTIRLLEEQLEVRLFDRNSRNVELTSAGEALLPIVERLTADFDHAFSELAQSFAGERGRVVVGALPSVAAGMLPSLLASFHATHPQVDITLRDSISGALLQQLNERQIDLAITTQTDEADLIFTPLMQDDMMLVVAAGGPHDTSEPASWTLLGEHPFIAMAPRSSVRELTDVVMARANVSAKPLYECTHLSTVGALIEAGLGITALPRSTLDMLQRGRIAARPLTDPVVERTIGIARAAGRSLSPAADAFLLHLLASVRPV
jgi:LysR family carnitine catabolism transcriptional activator